MAAQPLPTPADERGVGPVQKRTRVEVVVVTAIDPAAQQLLIAIHPSSVPAATDNAGWPRATVGLPPGRSARLPGSGAEAGEPAAGLLRCLLGFLLLAEALLLELVAFVGFGLLLDCDGPALAVLAQVRVRLGILPVPEVDRLQPVVGELPPAVRAHRPLCIPLRSFPLRAELLPFPGGLAAAGEGGVPAGVADRVQQRLSLSNFAAMRTASSVQLSTSMSSSGTLSSGAITTTSARALPIAGFFQVPFTGSATSVA